jgi:hypothetical protein
LAVNGFPGSGLRIFEAGNGTYKVYNTRTGDFGVHEADGKIVTYQNLMEQGLTKSEISSYLKEQGIQIESIPCTSGQNNGGGPNATTSANDPGGPPR